MAVSFHTCLVCFCAGAVVHRHAPPSHAVVAQDWFLDTLRSSARDDFHHTTQTIFTASVSAQRVPPGISYMSVKHAIYGEKHENLPPTPQTRDDIVVSGSSGNNLRGDCFVLPGPDQDTIFFATDENLRMLSICRLWLMAGTFNCVPGLFGRLYTIHGKIGSYAVPIVFTLLPNKQADTYRKMFERLFQYGNFLGVQLCPTEIITDCESAIVTVVKEVLPTTVHRICLFHFVQANYRYITENCGLTILYRDELDIQSGIAQSQKPAWLL